MWSRSYKAVSTPGESHHCWLTTASEDGITFDCLLLELHGHQKPFCNTRNMGLETFSIIKTVQKDHMHGFLVLCSHERPKPSRNHILLSLQSHIPLLYNSDDSTRKSPNDGQAYQYISLLGKPARLLIDKPQQAFWYLQKT